MKTIDQLMAEYVQGWKGYRVDGKGSIVLYERKLVEPLATKGSSIDFEVKGYDPKAKQYIAGVANAKEIDRMQEVLDPVGMVVGSYVKNSVMLYQHNHNCPIGLVTMLKAEDMGVLFEGWVGDPTQAPLTRMQEECRSLIAQRILKAVSVGFIPHKIRMPAYNDQGIMVDPAVIEQWELLELSVVAVPCNANALFDVKTPEATPTKSRLVSYASFPTLGKDGSFIIKPKGGQMDEIKEVLQKLNDSLNSIASGINAIKDGQAGIQKTLDTIGAAKAKKPDPEADPNETEPDGDADDNKKALAELTKRVDAMEAVVKDCQKSVDVLIKSLA